MTDAKTLTDGTDKHTKGSSKGTYVERQSVSVSVAVARGCYCEMIGRPGRGQSLKVQRVSM